MQLLRNLTFVGLTVLLACASLPAAPLRVGTFHKQSVVVAYYRSPLWSAALKAKYAERDAAKKANDPAKVKDLEAWGGTSQELAHRQLAGEAPLTNILEALAPAYPEIAKKAKVEAIAADLPYASAEVQTVDVTDLLLDWLKADEATRKIVHDLRTH